MHLFVTGIAGFVGVHLAEQALAEGDRVTGTYIEERPEIPGAELIEVDLLDRPAMIETIGRAAPDAVVHLGGLSHVGTSWRRMADYYRVNVEGTENLLSAVAAWERRGGTGPVPVVFASSGEVYGAVPEAQQPIHETRPPAPASPYALTKAAAERLALSGGWSCAVRVVRSFNLIGPGQAPTFALPAFAGQLAAIRRGEQDPVLKVGNLSARRDFVHVADGAAAYRLVARRGETGRVYNLASGRAVSIEEALRRLMEIAAVDARIETDTERVRPVDLPLLCGDAGALRQLGWQARYSLDEALGELWQESLEKEP